MDKNDSNQVTAVSTLHKSEELQREIYRTEAQMSETLHSIEEKLSPARLKEQAAQTAMQWAARGVNRVSDTYGRHKSVFALVGAGMLLMIGNKMRKSNKPEVVRQKRARKRLEVIAKTIAEHAAPSPVAGLLSKGIAVAVGTAIGTLLSQVRDKHAVTINTTP